ncbi:MAG: hypothetical protein U0T11_00980 [Chitinophagaceae bacterium]
MFEAFGGGEYELATTDWLTDRVVSLPIHTELEEEQQQFITQSVLEYLNSKNKTTQYENRSSRYWLCGFGYRYLFRRKPATR